MKSSSTKTSPPWILILLTIFIVACKKENKEASRLPCPRDKFMFALMMCESGGVPTKTFREPWGENSVGLFQLSASDSTRYSDCPTTEEELKDPEKNKKCADKIIDTLFEKYPDENWSKSLGRYWSCLRRGRDWPGYRVEPYARFSDYAKKINCQLD